MKIPIFVSSPTKLNSTQEAIRTSIFDALSDYQLEPRSLGQSDYPTRLPLREVLIIARHCAGALILGFEQEFAKRVEVRRERFERQKNGEDAPAKDRKNVRYPTPWNHLEAGILYSLGLPQLVFREKGITGGIFDEGVSDVFIHDMPVPNEDGILNEEVNNVFLKWQSDVRRHYYQEP